MDMLFKIIFSVFFGFVAAIAVIGGFIVPDVLPSSDPDYPAIAIETWHRVLMIGGGAVVLILIFRSWRKK